MSRSGYNYDGFEDEAQQWAHIRWRGALKSSLRGKRGQAFLHQLADALDAMPEKRLVTGALEADGDYCALGIAAKAKGIAIDLGDIEEDDWDEDTRDAVAQALDISPALAAEIMYENDEGQSDHRYQRMMFCGPMRYGHLFNPATGRYQWFSETHIRQVRVEIPKADERRWTRMRRWVQSQIIGATP